MTAEPLTVEGFAHMEKNWGGAFPDKWVWAQGMRLNRKSALSACRALQLLWDFDTLSVLSNL